MTVGATRMTRREWLEQAAARAAVAGAVCASTGLEVPAPAAQPEPSGSPAKVRVVVIRHASLESGQPSVQQVRQLLDEAARALAGQSLPADAWATWLRPADRLGVKVNCLGLATRPVLAEGLVAAAGATGLPPEQTIIWDRTSRELKAAGYELRNSGRGARCYGTDALEARGNAGYTAEVYTSGSIGSLFSRIVADEVTALVSACVLKDHNLAGMTGALKNFYGAIHNPNKYHDNQCDPFIADVCAHPLIRQRLRLAVCDAIRPQFNGGPPSRPQWQWPYGAIILGADAVAVDRVGLEIIERKRAAAGLPTLHAENRPARHLTSAQARGLGVADLGRIEVISIGKPWLDVG